MLPANPCTELLLVPLCIPAVEEKWCERVPTVQPRVLPLPDTRVASQENQVTSRLPGKRLFIFASQEESSCPPGHPGAQVLLSAGAGTVQAPF